jgi:acyl carrier protein
LKNIRVEKMERGQILEEIEELLDTEDLTEDQSLESVVEYDSMGILILMEWYDSLGVNVNPEEFMDFNAVSDLIDRAIQP